MILGLWLLAGTASAFPVDDIRVEGLQRVSAGRVINALNIELGDDVDPADTARAIRDLFKTGLFRDIRVGRDGNVLVVQVQERPAISKIDIEGNKNIETDQLLKALKAAGLEEGRVFRLSTLKQIELELLKSYIEQGRYSARVEASTEKQTGNRVKIRIEIKEGPVATIHHLNIVGNKDVDDGTLTDLLDLETTGFWANVFNSDKYSRQKLAGDLEKIRNWYLDHGYIKATIDSTEVSISPDREQVYITVDVTEGPQYRIRDVALKGDLIVPEAELRELIRLEPGEVFNQKQVNFYADLISKKLGAEGYTFATVSAIPTPHEEDKTATVTYYVDPGKRTYVRRINFNGNVSTADEVLRQQMLQMEAAPANSDLIEASKTRLDRLGFFKTVSVDTPLVPGHDDLIDVNYTVEEQPTGSLSASMGFSQSDGLLLGVSVTEKNFFGTGRSVSFGLNRSASVKSANLSYTNPFFTIDGVSRGFRVFYKETDYEASDISSYSSDNLGAAMTFGYPIDRVSRLRFGLQAESRNIKLGTYPAQEITDFINTNGNKFDAVLITGSWTRSTLNKGVYPTQGWSQTLGADITLPKLSDLTYYKVQYESDYYVPLSDSHEWVVRQRTNLAYGNAYGSTASLPFYEHYYAGGFGSVRGFENSSLGLRGTPDALDPDQSGDPFGGNLLTEFSLELIFPFALLEDRSAVRSALFLDAGNVFDTDRGFDPALDELRVSAGVSLAWITPVGPLSFSLGKAIRKKDGDNTQFFQFMLGQTF
ncbi:outer membrane protein assembly factor BamA [Hahella sp. SMD15-11]|uniref:Outer membrane protein assembly factor BamA n=1 Tax=Thermohahella caldifontis TaxID=3142973 RepID=A0AB39UZN3_9GAMM